MPLLAFIENIQFFKILVNYFNMDQHFLLAFERVDCQKCLTPLKLTPSGIEFFELKFEYLRENESFLKTILACLSGAQGG